MVENQTEKTFRNVTKMEASVSKAVFYSTMGYGSRLAMLDAALKASDKAAARKEYLKAVITRAGQYTKMRNSTLHGSIYFISDQRSKHDRKYVITRSKDEPSTMPKDEHTITVADLENMASNFYSLMDRFIPFLEWKEETHAPLLPKYLALVEQLPPDPRNPPPKPTPLEPPLGGRAAGR